MYRITKLITGDWLCEVTIQDGTERWREKTREKAIYSVISGARTLNHDYIRKDDIEFHEEKPKEPILDCKGVWLSKSDEELLSDIKRGEKVVLKHDDPLLRYRITLEECEMVQQIREGNILFK